MGCLERFLDWINYYNIPSTEKSIIEDLLKIDNICIAKTT